MIIKKIHLKRISLSLTTFLLFLTPLVGCTFQEKDEKNLTTLSSLSKNKDSEVDIDNPIKGWIKASYKDIELSIPQNWNYKSQEIDENFVFQISCWEKGSSNSFILQWVETEIELEEYLSIMKDAFRSESVHNNTTFSNNKTGVFQNLTSLNSTFNGSFMDTKFSGKLTAFNYNDKTFLIIHQENNEFYNPVIANKIISSIKLDSKNELTQSKVPDNWTLYEIENIGQLTIPNTLELRDENSFIALGADIMHDAVESHLKIKMPKHQLVFQPVGRNQLDKESSTKYARIMVRHVEAEYGDFYRWNEKIELTDSEKKELNNEAKNEISSPMAAMNIKLIEWLPIEFGSVNGLSYMKTSFTRQLANNPIVNVDTYRFFNSNEAVEVTLSYRLSESSIWKSDFSKVIKTFDFKNKK